MTGYCSGGLSAFIGAAVIGPRVNRFNKAPDGTVTAVNIVGHASPLAVLGVWLLMFGWMSFNSSRLDQNYEWNYDMSSRSAVNTLIAFSFGVMVCLYVRVYLLMLVHTHSDSTVSFTSLLYLDQILCILPLCFV